MQKISHFYMSYVAIKYQHYLPHFQDLVAWVTLGTIHIPHTGDIPVVTTQNTQLTFHILPYNYFDEDPSLASRDNIRVHPNRHYKGAHDYQYSGLDNCVGCTPRSSANTLAISGGMQFMLLMVLVASYMTLIRITGYVI